MIPLHNRLKTLWRKKLPSTKPASDLSPVQNYREKKLALREESFDPRSHASASNFPPAENYLETKFAEHKTDSSVGCPLRRGLPLSRKESFAPRSRAAASALQPA